jgi:hypothetical protein
MTDAPYGLPGNGPLHRFQRRETAGFLPPGYIDGLIIANDTTDAVNDLVIANGIARSSHRLVDGAISTAPQDQTDLDLPASVIKQLDVAFAPDNYDPDGYSGGDRSGGRSSSSIANSTWHLFLVGGRGLQPDVLIHDAVTPSAVFAEMAKCGGYSAFRHIASIRRIGGALQSFFQNPASPDYFSLSVPVRDHSSQPASTAAQTITLGSVPAGLSVIADIGATVNGASTGGGVAALYTALVAADTTPSSSLFDVISPADVVNYATTRKPVVTNSSAQIRGRLSHSGANDALIVHTYGWWHPRGRM